MTAASSSASPTPDSSHGVHIPRKTDGLADDSPSQVSTRRGEDGEPETPQNGPKKEVFDSRYLQPSPYGVDEGYPIGRDPRKIPTSDLKALGHPISPIKAIRAKCLDCAESEAEVRKCVQHDCPLWPMRMGNNTLHGKGGR